MFRFNLSQPIFSEPHYEVQELINTLNKTFDTHDYHALHWLGEIKSGNLADFTNQLGSLTLENCNAIEKEVVIDYALATDDHDLFKRVLNTQVPRELVGACIGKIIRSNAFGFVSIINEFVGPAQRNRLVQFLFDSRVFLDPVFSDETSLLLEYANDHTRRLIEEESAEFKAFEALFLNDFTQIEHQGQERESFLKAFIETFHSIDRHKDFYRFRLHFILIGVHCELFKPYTAVYKNVMRMDTLLHFAHWQMYKHRDTSINYLRNIILKPHTEGSLKLLLKVDYHDLETLDQFGPGIFNTIVRLLGPRHIAKLAKQITLENKDSLLSQAIIQFVANQRASKIQSTNDGSLGNVAICMSGQLRGFIPSISNAIEKLAKPLNADVFVHTWDDIGFAYGPHADRLGRRLPELIRNSVSSVREELFFKHFPELSDALDPGEMDPDESLSSFKEAYQSDTGNLFQYAIESDSAIRKIKSDYNIEGFALFMFYKMRQVFNLMHSAEKQKKQAYDTILWMRPDFSFESIRFPTLVDSCIFSSFVGGDGGTGDHFILGSRDSMWTLSLLYDAYLNAWKKFGHCAGGPFFIGHCMKTRGIASLEISIKGKKLMGYQGDQDLVLNTINQKIDQINEPKLHKLKTRLLQLRKQGELPTP